MSPIKWSHRVTHQAKYDTLAGADAAKAGLDPRDWTPRELRHSFVSLLSDSGMSLEQIADLCGHSGTTVTESVYRHQLRPVLLGGAVAMDRIFDPEA
ncbi:tyrosine-type recombinase/integrase [Micromonospora sp. NPDC049301]|uniref:tyrosine-type recombinase/integrase n=1 Tax=Micromonospora sp. NPDC049301 TaxID=3155723 RepID=UPI00343DD7FE